jgi:hypothetical protein
VLLEHEDKFIQLVHKHKIFTFTFTHTGTSTGTGQQEQELMKRICGLNSLKMKNMFLEEGDDRPLIWISN